MTKSLRKTSIIKRTESYVESLMSGDNTGHDYLHIQRVCDNAIKIAKTEKGVDIFVVKLAVLLHDIDDYKLGGKYADDAKLARAWMKKNGLDKETTDKIARVICEISFKGASVNHPISYIESAIVQDADRLDAMGAVGIARAFSYGASKGRTMYNPKEKPVFHKSFAKYKMNESSTINHFFEKLLLLKDRLNTKEAKRMAKKRHKFMLDFLSHFFKEAGVKNLEYEKLLIQQGVHKNRAGTKIELAREKESGYKNKT